MHDFDKLANLRVVITENLRVQKDQESIEYVDVGSALADVSAKQNHAIFARRGCGKTLLLHHTASNLPDASKAIYLNCEDFKHHSFPNVLIEILVSLLTELQQNATGWFGKKKKTNEILNQITRTLKKLQKNQTKRKSM